MESREKIEAVHRMQEYIESHLLTEQITLPALAKAAGYSPWHRNNPPKLFMPGRVRDYYLKLQKGYDIIELSPCKMMVFQGQPFDEEKFEEASGAKGPNPVF